MVLAPYLKKAATPFEFFPMPILSKGNKDKEASKRDLNIAEMFNTGLLNPLKEKNKNLYNRLKLDNLIDEKEVNKYILEKWQKK